jgi:hypothetical protein
MLNKLNLLMSVVLTCAYFQINACEKEEDSQSKALTTSSNYLKEELKDIPSTIQLFNGKTYQVCLGQRLKNKLLKERAKQKLSGVPGETSLAFYEQFEEAKSCKVSDKVLALYFDISDNTGSFGKIYIQSFGINKDWSE